MKYSHAWTSSKSSVGVLVLEEEDEEGVDLGQYAIYMTIVAWAMVGIGVLYFLMVSHISASEARDKGIRTPSTTSFAEEKESKVPMKKRVLNATAH